MPVLTLIDATVRYPSDKVFDGKHGGKRRKLVLTTASGEDVTSWGNADDPVYLHLKKGDRCKVYQEKNNWEIALERPLEVAVLAPNRQPLPPQSQQPDPATPPSNGWSGEQRMQLKEDVQRRAKLLAFCHEQVAANFSNLSEDAIVRYTTTLFTEICKQL